MKFCDRGYVPQDNFAHQNSSATAEQNTKFQHQLISIEDHVININSLQFRIVSIGPHTLKHKFRLEIGTVGLHTDR